MMGYHYEMRREEIFGPTWDKINLIDGRIARDSGITKNDEARVIYLTSETYEAISKQKKLWDMLYPECPFVFFRKGQRLSDFRVSWWKHL